MKILYYHQHFSTPKGATGTRSYEFSKSLINRGHEVTIICGSHWIGDSGLSGNFEKGIRRGIVDNINVIEFDLSYSNSDNFMKRTFTFLKYSIKGIKIALLEDYDLLFATSTPLTAGIPGIFSKLFRRKVFIFEVRDLWPELPMKMGVITHPILILLMRILEYLTYWFSDACIGLSPGIVEGIKKKVNNKNVVMIPNGCDNDLLGSSVKKVKINNFTVAFTGAHGIANGLNSILDTAEVIIDRGITNIEFQFIGDGALKEDLISRAKRKRIHNCLFLNPMPKEKLFHHLKKNVHVGLMVLDNVPAFYYGTSPNKFFDYISLGLPVLNNYPGWLAEIITKNQIGIVVSPNNADEFADAIVKLSQDDILLKKMGTNARYVAKKTFDRKKLSNVFVDFIEKNTLHKK